MSRSVLRNPVGQCHRRLVTLTISLQCHCRLALVLLTLMISNPAHPQYSIQSAMSTIITRTLLHPSGQGAGPRGCHRCVQLQRREGWWSGQEVTAGRHPARIKPGVRRQWGSGEGTQACFAPSLLFAQLSSCIAPAPLTPSTGSVFSLVPHARDQRCDGGGWDVCEEGSGCKSGRP